MIRILLAEDSPTQALMLQAKLVDEGYEVQVAGDGKQALGKIPEFWPHLLLTDMQMPEMDGLELVARASAEYPTIPIVLITAEGSEKLSVEALERGAAAYLCKSSLDECLFSTLDEVLDVMESASSYADLIRCMDSNLMRFTLQNRLELIRPLVDLVKQMAIGVSLCDESEAVRLGIAVAHALRNAMLHGNLELSTAELESDSEFVVQGEQSLAEKRSRESGHCDRRVHVTVDLSPAEVQIVVRDDGLGFDPSIFCGAQDATSLDSDSGRGLVLIQSLMDQVSFNASGNEITMTKRRHES